VQRQRSFRRPAPGAPSPARPRPRPRDLLDGAACLGRGLGIFAGTPRLWVIGLLPALLALIVLVALVGGFVAVLPAAVTALTPFASGWSQVDRDALRLLVGLVLAVGAGWLALISYTAVAVAIGQPFYEAISRRVDEREGGTPAVVEVPWWRAIGRALRDGLLLVAVTAGVSLALFALGFVPLLGQTIVPVLGACVTGFFLAVELSSVALERRGLALRERLRLMWRRRLLTLGFGLAAFLLFLVPLGAVVGMPGAIAGGTLLARRLTPPG
jgi:CysZ protein